VLPPEADREAGRQYLASRGLDDATIAEAEKAGVLRYARGAVLLVARDEHGEARHVLRRGYREDDPAPKRALSGSDTSHPVVLRGDPSRVVVVEGPITGLAAQSLARLRGDPPPTVVVTGGVGMRRWVRVATDVLRAARTVEIAAEREADPQRQAATDAARERLAAAIEDATGRPPRITWPAPGAGDLADELAARRAEERRRREEEFLQRIEEEARQRAEAAARRNEEERRRTPEARRAEEQRRQAEARSTPEARRAMILQEEIRRAQAQLAQARTSWEREAVERAAKMRAVDRWRAEGIMPKEPRPGRRRQHDERWEPPAPCL
jgi:flagellar biosynthesis GTPase FlhF